jgi:hypothetical protein
MADYYTQFSFQIRCDSQEEKDYLLHYADEPDDTDSIEYREWEDDRHGFDVEETQDDLPVYVWIHDGGDGSPDNVANMITDYQVKFGKDKAVSFTYANTCSKPRLESFHGGGVLIHKGKQYWAPSPYEWISNKLKELEI